MAETSIDPKVLEDALSNALKTLLLTSSETRASNPHEEFYDKVQNESNEYDKYFLHKYGKDLDTTLLFAALFSAISASFILDIQTRLEPDYSKLNYAALVFIANSTQIRGSDQLPSFGVSPDRAIWTGPDPTIVHVQTALFSSLAISLLAAFIAMLSKQWLGRYSESHGSITDRGRDRHRKIKGVTTWHFDLIMECLPLLLQLALFLFSYALSIYLFTINKAVAAVTVGLTSFGLLFYILVVSVATLSYNCPFQTPLSLFFRTLFRLKDKDKNYLGQAWSRLKRMLPGGLRRSGRPNVPEEDRGDYVKLAMAGPFGKPPRLAAGLTAWNDYVVDTECIAWLSQRSRSTEVVMAIAGLVPEIIWHADMGTSPLKQLYDIMLECFDSSSKPLALIPKLREKAYLSAKAFVHLAVQRQGVKSEKDVFQFISLNHSAIEFGHYDTDSDLESTLVMVDRVFKGDDSQLRRMRWDQFSFTVPHHIWMGYTLRCYTWRALRKNPHLLPSDVEEFVRHSFRLVPPPPDTIVVECLHIISLFLGITLRDDGPPAIDLSHRVSSHIDSIYEQLETIWNNTSTFNESAHALKAMELIIPLSTPDVATKSYRLFRTVMHTTTHSWGTWEASRLALHGAYKGGDLPPVDDPRDALTFLNYHFELALQGENQDEPIQDALRALAYASGPAAIKAVDFDLTQPSFVRGIHFAFEANRPREVREAALFFLPLIGDTWFDAAYGIIPGEMGSFCVDWATAVDSIEHTERAKKAILMALFHMMDSPNWRHLIPEGKWKLLKYYPSIPEDCQPWKKCLENPKLVADISQVTDPEAIALWPRVLWLKYDELTPPVQEALIEVTKSAQGRRHIDTYYQEVSQSLEEAEGARMMYETWSYEPVVIALERKIKSDQRAIDALKAIKSQR